jgi:hypothetical protein
MSQAKMVWLQILMFVPLFFIPATDVIIHPAYEQWKSDKAQAHKTAQRLVQYAAASDRQLIEQTRLLLTVLSKSRPAILNSESCGSLVADLLKNQPFFITIGVADASGNVFCNGRGATGINIADRDSFHEALRTGRFIFDGYSSAEAGGVRAIDLACPILNESGQALGLVFAAVDLKAFDPIVQDHMPENIVFLTVDSKGTILSRYPGVDQWIGRSMPNAPVVKAMLEKKEGAVQEKDLDGVERNFVFGSATGSTQGELFIAAGILEKPFDWLSEEMIKCAATLLGIIALFGFTAGWLASRHIPGRK